MTASGDTTPAQRQAAEPSGGLLALDAAESGMHHMIELTLDAVNMPRGADGVDFTPDRAENFQNACAGEIGVALTADIVLRASPDEATMAADILAAWDDAGYRACHAVREDIRYSATMPVASLALHDTTTIDALVHMHIASRCSARR